MKSNERNLLFVPAILIVFGFAACGQEASVSSAETKVIGGQDAEKGEFPYQVELLYDGEHMCGGSLINREWVLTAAHCIYSFDMSKLTIVLGEHKLSEKEPSEQKTKPTQTIIHPQYNTMAVGVYDVALVRIYPRATLNKYVQTIDLGSYLDDQPGQVGMLTGWGYASPGPKGSGVAADILQKVGLNIKKNSICSDYFKSIGGDWLRDFELCTVGDANKTACYGDSGGPLVVTEKDQDGNILSKKQVGITSYRDNSNCTTPYAVFARVSSVKDWIEKTIDNEPVGYGPCYSNSECFYNACACMVQNGVDTTPGFCCPKGKMCRLCY